MDTWTHGVEAALAPIGRADAETVFELQIHPYSAFVPMCPEI